VVPEEVTAQLREVLADVVEEGTGQAASMGAFRVAGKTGTARIALGGRYVPGAYTATFAGFFPADDPQIVFVVKLDRPRGAYYGGLTAAPVTRATLEAALAARGTPIDKSAIATASPTAESTVVTVARGNARFASLGAPRVAEPPRRAPVALPIGFAAAAAAAAGPAVEVPDVAGLPLRDAAALLHAAGFHVRVEGSGTVRGSEPAAGALLVPGKVVRVLRREAGR
jgi:membrane peptidoglycan carboxypeptidase